MGLAAFGFIWLGGLLGFVSLIAGLGGGQALVLFLLLAVSVNDVAAYAVEDVRAARIAEQG